MTMTNSITKESKELFARLLASENFSIQYSNDAQPAFNIKQRILKIPTWVTTKDDIEQIFILLHESAHAKWTDLTIFEKAMAQFSDTNNQNRWKNIYNMVEDARIEKLLQQKFPGSINALREGSKKVINSGYMGEEVKELLNNYENNPSHYQKILSESVPFLSRLGLHFRIEKYYPKIKIPFSEDEKKILKKIQDMQTNEEAVEIANSLFQKQESEEKENFDQSELGDEKNLSNMDNVTSEHSNTNQNSEKEDEEDVGESQSQSENTNQLSDDNKNNMDGPEMGEELSKTPFDFNSIQNALSAKMIENAQNCDIQIVNVNFNNTSRKICRESILDYTDKKNFKKITKTLSRICENTLLSSKINTVFGEVLKEQRKLSNTLSQEFQRKKTAREHKKTLISETGKLNLKKLHNYKHTEDIFLKSEIKHSSKNHGMIMFIDFSGSMSIHSRFLHTIIQTFGKMLFCRSNGIPYELYTFTTMSSYNYQKNTQNDISFNDGDIMGTPNLKLVKYSDHKQSKKDFYETMKFLFLVGNVSCSSYRDALDPDFYDAWLAKEVFKISGRLSGTPLVETALISQMLVEDFLKKNPVEILNLVYLTDGDDQSSSLSVVNNNNTIPNSILGSNGFNILIQYRIDSNSSKAFILRNQSVFLNNQNRYSKFLELRPHKIFSKLSQPTDKAEAGFLGQGYSYGPDTLMEMFFDAIKHTSLKKFNTKINVVGYFLSTGEPQDHTNDFEYWGKLYSTEKNYNLVQSNYKNKIVVSDNDKSAYDQFIFMTIETNKVKNSNNILGQINHQSSENDISDMINEHTSRLNAKRKFAKVFSDIIS